MAGSRKNEFDAAPDCRAHSAAAADRSLHVVAGGETPSVESADQPDLDPARPGYLGDAVAVDA